MAKVITSRLVSLDDLPCGKFWVERTGGKVVENWQEAPSVTEKDAAKAMEAYEADLAEHEAKQTAYQAYVRQWEQERAAVAQKADEEATPQLIRQQVAQMTSDGTFWVGDSVRIQAGRLGPGARAALREVRREAVEEYDRTHPLMDLLEFMEKGV